MVLKGDDRSGAIFSDDMQYRYRLWRCWEPALPRACFCLLNPSTANEIENDPTIERQQRRVEGWGALDLFDLTVGRFGSIEIVNAFALRSMNPKGLYAVADPIGPENNAAILNATTSAVGSGGIVVCGWGGHAAQVFLGAEIPSRHEFLRAFFNRHNVPVCAFNLNDDGTPQHPLYLPYSLKPRVWNLDSTLGAEVA